MKEFFTPKKKESKKLQLIILTLKTLPLPSSLKTKKVFLNNEKK